MTDIRAAPHRFPPPADQVADALAGVFRPRDAHNTYGTASTAAVAEAHEGREGSQADEFVPITRSQWEWTPDMSGGQRYACRGMALSAMWLLGQVGPSLVALADSGYEIVLTGHSLGAGVACLLLELLRSRCPAVRAVVYGCPSCVDRETAEMLRPRYVRIETDVVALSHSRSRTPGSSPWCCGTTSSAGSRLTLSGTSHTACHRAIRDTDRGPLSPFNP